MFSNYVPIMCMYKFTGQPPLHSAMNINYKMADDTKATVSVKVHSNVTLYQPTTFGISSDCKLPS